MQIDESTEIEIICLSSGLHCKLLICLECPCDFHINSYLGKEKIHISPEEEPKAKYFPL
jgi:hypothetical protein